MKELYLEQLLARAKPKGRTEEGWARILKGVQDQFDERVDRLHTVIDVHSCALRALKDKHLREVYIGFCAEDVAEYACSNSLVESIVYAPEEHPDFYKDLELCEQTSSSSFGPLRDAPEREVDLEPGSNLQFQCVLTVSNCPVEAIDLD